ncbi:hypothetical protein Q0M91_14210, partial [Staphylococcus aureus]|nr:hypothetical protein [Staphylococcus aureus]
MKTELVARTEERDALRQQVDALNTQKGDLARKVAASPAARYNSPAAHFSSYAAQTPMTPYSAHSGAVPYPTHTPTTLATS